MKLISKEWQAALVQFMRNGRWGTCSGCPRDTNKNVYPEFCEFTNRYDHKLKWEDLDWQIRRDLDGKD